VGKWRFVAEGTFCGTAEILTSWHEVQYAAQFTAQCACVRIRKMATLSERAFDVAVFQKENRHNSCGVRLRGTDQLNEPSVVGWHKRFVK
jgi:hypothetical protein